MTTFVVKQPSSRQGTTQNLSMTSSSAAIANSFGADTFQILVTATAACNVRIGDGTPTATTADMVLPANTPMTFTVTSAQKLAAVTATTATLNVMKLSLWRNYAAAGHHRFGRAYRLTYEFVARVQILTTN